MLTQLLLVTALSPTVETALERATQAFRDGRYPAVIEAAADVDRTTEDWPRLQYLVGETQLLLGAPAPARDAFENVLGQRPRAVPALVGLARAKMRLEDLGGAEAALEQALTAEPDDVGARLTRGELLGLRGKTEEARRLLAGLRKAEPDNAFVVRALVEVLLRGGDTEWAGEIAAGFVKERPKHPMGPFLAAVVHERAGQVEPAIAAYQAAIERDTKFLDAHKNLAILCHTMSDTYQDKRRTRLAYAHYARYFELGGADADLRRMYDQLLQFKDQILGS